MSDNTIVITTSGSVSFLYNVYIFDASGGNIVLTLGNAATTNGFNYKLKRKDTSINTVTIAGFNSSQLIDGNVNQKLLIGSEMNLTSIGGLWYGNTLNESSGNVFLNGDGSDDVTISINTDLTRDMYYNNLTVNSGITLFTKGFRIFVKGTLNVNGVINNTGQASSSSTGGIGATVGSLGGGANGGNGGPFTGAGQVGGSVPLLSQLGGNGGNGGAGDPGNSGGAGGIGGTSSSPGVNSGGPVPVKSLPSLFSGRDLDGNKLYGGNGGGGGGGTNGGVPNGAGGGGGGGGMIISARVIISSSNTGSFTVNGGSGGNGNTIGTFVGGGGGGGGGYMIIISGKNYIPSTSFTATGGAPGTDISSGTAPTAGVNGIVLSIQQ